MNSWFGSQKLTAVVGLALQGTAIEGTVVRRSGQGTQLGSSFRHTFSADPVTGDPVALGRELRAALDAAEIRERPCTVALPVSWLMTLSTPLPDLSQEDAESLLQIEAERGFSFPIDSLSVVNSRLKASDGSHHATQLAIQRERITRLDQLLQAARLSAVSITPGALRLAEILTPGPNAGSVVLVPSDSKVDLIVQAGGGVAGVRSWDLPLETPGRELRLTLAQLPAGLSSTVQRLQITGTGSVTDSLAAELAASAGTLGLAIEPVTRFPPGASGLGLPSDTPISVAVAVAAAHLADRPQAFEFLPPRVSAWQQYSEKYASRKLVLLGQVAGAIAAVMIAAFLWQQFQISRLQSQWSKISGRVRVVEELQLQIKKYRPWYDSSVRSLAILRRLTEAFPEDGEVTAKIVEIRESGVVTCTGTARDQGALLRTLDRLRAAQDVTGVQLDQVRGKAPMQFSFNFQWTGALR